MDQVLTNMTTWTPLESNPEVIFCKIRGFLAYYLYFIKGPHGLYSKTWGGHNKMEYCGYLFT